MTLLILDTNIVSELMKPMPDFVFASWWQKLQDVELVTTVITVSEITYGLGLLPEGKRKARLFQSFDALVGVDGVLAAVSVNEVSARTAGEFRTLRYNAGLSNFLGDALIAGIVHSLKGQLVTRNTKDFVGLGLDQINPWD